MMVSSSSGGQEVVIHDIDYGNFFD